MSAATIRTHPGAGPSEAAELLRRAAEIIESEERPVTVTIEWAQDLIEFSVDGMHRQYEPGADVYLSVTIEGRRAGRGRGMSQSDYYTWRAFRLGWLIERHEFVRWSPSGGTGLWRSVPVRRVWRAKTARRLVAELNGGDAA